MTAETRNILTIIKKNIIRGNIFKRLRGRIRNINNGYPRVRMFVRPRKN